MADKHLNEAIDRLAELFEFGALQVATAPATFIDCVTDEIKRLRRELEETKTERDEAQREVALLDVGNFSSLVDLERCRTARMRNERDAFGERLSDEVRKRHLEAIRRHNLAENRNDRSWYGGEAGALASLTAWLETNTPTPKKRNT